MKSLWTGVLILAVCLPCVFSSSLQVELATADSIQTCLNRNVTFVCTVQFNTIQWTVDSLLTGNDGVVSVGTLGALNTETSGMFTLTAEGAGAPNFMSTLQVAASPILNNTMVRCASTLNPNMSEEVLLTIYDVPDVPQLDDIVQSTHNNNEGLMFTFGIFQSDIAASCVIQYNITISGCGQTYYALVDASQLNATYNTMSAGALPVCCEDYEFTVFGVDSGNRKSEAFSMLQSVNFTALASFSGVFSQDKEAGGIIDVTIPDILRSLVVDYIYTVDKDSGRISDIGNKFTFSENNIYKIVIDDPCKDCRIYLTPVLCNSTLNLTTTTFFVDTEIIDIPSTATSGNANSPSTGPPDDDGRLSLGATIGIAVAAVAASLVFFLIVVVCLFIMCKKKSVKPMISESKSGVEMKAQLDFKPEDNMPTYQAPETIKRETASNTGDVYTVPEKKGKQTKASRPPPEDLPTYSVVDKGKKGDNLVYADLDVKNPVARSKRPPPPPGVTEHDANEPVLYSTVH